MRDVCWEAAASRSDDGDELVRLLANDDPQAFWEALRELIAVASNTDEAAYLYGSGILALGDVNSAWPAVFREEARADRRVAAVIFAATQFTDRVVDFLGMPLIVERWVEYTSKNDPSDFWAAMVVMDAGRWSDDDQWGLILDLLAAAPDEHVVEMVGVGPLEDWIGGGWEEGIRRIEEEAPRNERLREALAGIWIDGIPEEFFLRVEKAAGVPLTRFAPRQR